MKFVFARFKDIASAAAIAATTAWLCWSAAARNGADAAYPSKYITLVCPFSAGGGTDILCRTLGAEMSKKLGKPVAVINAVGGAGALGFVQGASAAPDAYTLAMLTFEITPLSLRGFAPVSAEDFEFVALLNADPACIAVPANSEIKDMAGFVAASKKSPKSVGNSGVGSVWHLASETFALKSGAKIAAVPFDGASGAITAMIGGHIDAVCVSAAELKPHADAGRARILGVMCAARLKAFPDLPTCKEAGIDVEFSTWRAVAAPKGTPKDRIKILQSAIAEFGKSDAAREFAERTGANMEFKNGADFAADVAKQRAEIAEIMRKINLIK